MKFKRLAERIQLAIQMAVPKMDIWDIGCDHGYLGISAIMSGSFSQVHFVDPVFNLNHRFKKNLKNVWKCKVEQVTQSITGTFIFLGVGASTQISALQRLQYLQLLHCQRIILGPHKDAKELDEFCLEGYRFVEKVITFEKGRTRPLYVFDKI